MHTQWTRVAAGAGTSSSGARGCGRQSHRRRASARRPASLFLCLVSLVLLALALALPAVSRAQDSLTGASLVPSYSPTGSLGWPSNFPSIVTPVAPPFTPLSSTGGTTGGGAGGGDGDGGGGSISNDLGELDHDDDVEPLSVIKIGVYGCRVPTLAGGCWRDDPNRLRGLWEAHVAARPLLGRYRVELYEAPLETQPPSNQTELIEATASIMAAAGGRVDFIVLPMGSIQWSDSIMPELERQRIVTLAVSPLSSQYQCDPLLWRTQPGCTAPNTRRFKYASSVLNSGARYFTSWLGMVRVHGVRRVGLLYTRSALYLEMAEGVRDAAATYGMSLTYDRGVEGVDGGVARVLPERIDEAVAELAAIPDELAPDALVLIVWNCVPWIRAMRSHAYLPRALGALRCVDDDFAQGALGDDLRFVSGPGQWSERLATDEYTENLDVQPWSLFPAIINGTRQAHSSAHQFANAYRRLYNLSDDATPNYGDAAYLACFTALEAAVTLANSTGKMAVQDALNSMFQSSFFGILSFNRFNINEQKGFLTFQRDGAGTLQIVDPFVSATQSFVYPMPHWRDRVYTGRPLRSEVENAFAVVMAVCMLTTGALCVYLYRHRHRQVLYAAGLPFYLMIGAGCLVAYASILTWPVDNDVHTCAARIWMWSAPFYLLCAPILANSYRIARILSLGGTLKKTTFTTRHTLLIAAGIMLPQLLVNVVWSALDPLRPVVESPDPIRPAHNYTSCAVGEGGSLGFALLVTSLCIGALCLFVVCVLAWRIRHGHTLFNDARPLGIAMYLCALIALILLVLHTALDARTRAGQKLLFALRSAGVLLAYQTTIALLFLRRILHKNQSVTSDLHATDAFKAGAGVALSYRQPYTSAAGGGGDAHLAVQMHSRATDRHKRVHVVHAPAGSSSARARAMRLPGGACGSSTGGATTAVLGDTPRQPLTTDDSGADEGEGGGGGGRGGGGASGAPARLSNIVVSGNPGGSPYGADADADSNQDALDRDLSSFLLALTPPRFHLPPRSEYSTFSRDNLVALVDEAADTIAELYALLGDERSAMRQRVARMGQRAQGAVSGAGAGSPQHVRWRSAGASLSPSPIVEEGRGANVLVHLHQAPDLVSHPSLPAGGQHTPPRPHGHRDAHLAVPRRYSSSSARNPLSEIGHEDPSPSPSPSPSSPSPSPSSPSPSPSWMQQQQQQKQKQSSKQAQQQQQALSPPLPPGDTPA